MMNFLHALLITMAMLLFKFFCLQAGEEMVLRDNLQRAHQGDYVVTAQGKTYTVLHIFEKKNDLLTIEEISAPSGRLRQHNTYWKNWIKQGAPGHTSWIMYTIDLKNGKMLEYYSLTKNAWYDTSKTDSFLTTLLNLPLEQVPYQDRRKVGLPPLPGLSDKRSLWQPQMIVEGKEIIGVPFDAWRTVWPKDGSDLSGKTIEVFTPQNSQKYPSYFPYWLQISGLIGKAKIRIIDSGSNMESPAPPLQKQRSRS